MPDFHIPNDPEWQWAYDAILYTTGGEFPEANPTALRAMGDELYAFTNNLLNGTAATSNLGNGLSAYLDGPAADAFNQFRAGIANDVPTAGNISWALGNAAYEFALDSESTQYNIVIAAFTQVVEIAFAIASGFGAAAVPALIKIGQEIVKTLIDFLRMRLQNQLLRLVWEGIEEGLEELWQGMAAQLTQMAEGNRKGFDYQDLALAFAGGLFIGMGVSGMHAIGGKLYPKINKNTYTRETLSALAETLFEGLFNMMVGGGFNPFATMTSSIIGGLAHQYAHDFGNQFNVDPNNLPNRPPPDSKKGSNKGGPPATSVAGPPPPAYHDIGDRPPSYDQAAGSPPPHSETQGDLPPYNEATGPSNAATGAPPSVGSSPVPDNPPVPGNPVTNGSHTTQPSDAERDGALTPATAPAFANRPDLSTVDAPAPNRSVAPAPSTASASAGALRPGIAGVNQLGPASGQVPAQTTGSAGSVAAHPAATPAAPPPATSPAEDVAPIAAPAGASATLPANVGGLPGFESTSPAASIPTDPTAPAVFETTAPTSTRAADAAASPAADPAGQAPTVVTPVTAVPAVEVPRTGGPGAESPVVPAPTGQSPAPQPLTTQSPGQQTSSGSIPNAQENNTPLSSASPPPQVTNPLAPAPATIEQGSTVPGPAVEQALASESGVAGQALDTQQNLVTSNPHHVPMTTTTTQPSPTSGTVQSPLSSDGPPRSDSTRDTTTRTEGAGDRDSRSQADGPRRASGQHDPVVTVSPTVEVAPATSRGHTDIVDIPSGSSTDPGAEDGPRTTAASIGPTADDTKPSPVTPQAGPTIPTPQGAPDAVLRTEPAAASTSNPEATAPTSPSAPVPANESDQGQSTTESYDGLALGGTGSQGAVPGSASALLADVVPRDQWWRLYLDPRHHAAAQAAYPDDPGSYYDNDQSPGFQRGMTEAYEQFLNNPGINSNTLNADTYKQIHETVTRHLNRQFDWTGGTTRQGVIKPTSFPVRNPDISSDVLAERIGERPLIKDFHEALRQRGGPKPVTFTSTIMGRGGISATTMPRTITTNYSRTDAPALVNTIFDQYRHERQNATTPDATLAAIARTIRKLHITHPFEDGNRRLNVHVILPKLLLDNGFQPVIAPDMDQLFQGGRSIDDIVSVLRNTQPATGGIRLGTEPNPKADGVPVAQIPTVVDVPAITSVAAQTDTTALATSSDDHRHDSSSVVPLATVVRGADGVLRASGKPLVIRPLTGDRPGIALLDDGDWNRVSTRTLLPPDTYAAAQDVKGDPATAVIVHGVGDVVHAPVRNPDGSTTTVALGPDGLAQVIGRPGAPIVLVSCETGALTGGFAHQLAHAHDGDVLAPKTVINIGATGVEGGLRTTDSESWQLYTPHSLDDEGWDAVNDVATGTPPLFGINADPEPTTDPGAGTAAGSTTGQSNRSNDGIVTVRRSTQSTPDGIRLGPKSAPPSNIARAAQPPSLPTIPEETEQDLDPPGPFAPSAVSRDREERRVPQPGSRTSGEEPGYTGADDPADQVAAAVDSRDGGESSRVPVAATEGLAHVVVDTLPSPVENFASEPGFLVQDDRRPGGKSARASATDNGGAGQASSLINPDGTSQKHGTRSEDTAPQPTPIPHKATTHHSARPAEAATAQAFPLVYPNPRADLRIEFKVESDPQADFEVDSNPEPKVEDSLHAGSRAEADHARVKGDAKAELEPGPESKAEPAPESRSESKAEVQPEPGPEPESKAEPGPESKAEAQPGPEPESKAEPGPEADAKAEVQPEPEPEPEPEPGPGPGPGPESKAKSEPESRSESKAEVQPEPGPGPGPESKAEPGPESKAEAQPEPEADAKAEVQPEPEPGPGPGPESKAEPAPESRSESKAEPEPGPEPESKAEPGPESKAEPGPEADAKAEVQPEPGPEPGPESKAEPAPESRSESKAEPGPESKAEPGPEADAKAEVQPEPGPEPESKAEPAHESRSESEADFKAEAEQKTDSGNGNSPTVLSPDKLRSALPDYLRRSEALGPAAQFRSVTIDHDTSLIRELELLAPGMSQSVLEELDRDVRDDFGRFLGEGYSYPVRIGGEAAELTVTARFDWDGIKPEKKAKEGPKAESKSDGSHSRSVKLDHYPHVDPKFFISFIPSALVTGGMSIPTAPRSTNSRTIKTSFKATTVVEVEDQIEVTVPAVIYASLQGSAGQTIDARPSEKRAFSDGPGKVTARGIVPLRVPTKLAVPEPGPDPLPARVPTALPKRFGVESVVVHSDPDRGTHFKQVAEILQKEGLGDIVRVGAPGRSVLKQFLSRDKLPVADATTVGADRAEEGWVTSEPLLRTPAERNLWRRVFPGRGSALQVRLVARQVRSLGTADGVKYEDGFKLAGENTDSQVADRPWAAMLTGGGGGVAGPLMYVVGPRVTVSRTEPTEQKVAATRVGRQKVKVKGSAVRYRTVYDLEVRLIGRPAQRLDGAVTTVQWTTKDRVRGTSLDSEPTEWQGRTGDRRTHFAPAPIEQGRSFGGAYIDDLDGGDQLRRSVIRALRNVPMTKRLIPALNKKAFVRQFGDPELAQGLTGPVQAILSRREDIEAQLSNRQLRFMLDRIVGPGLEIPLTMNGKLHDYTTVVVIKGKLSSLSDGEILSQKVSGATENRAAKDDVIVSKDKSWASSIGVDARLIAVLGPAFPVGIVGPRVGYTASSGHDVGVKRRHEFEIARAPDLKEDGGLAEASMREFAATLTVTTTFESSVRPNPSRLLLTPGWPGLHVPTVVSGALPSKEHQLELRLLVPEHRVTLSPPPSAPAPEPVDREWMTNPPALREISGGYPYKLDGSLVETFLGSAQLLEGVKETLTRATNDPIWSFADGSISTLISQSLAPDQLTGGSELFSTPLSLSQLTYGRRRADAYAEVKIRLRPHNPRVQAPIEFHTVKDVLAGGSSSGAKQARSWGGSLSITPVGVVRGPAGDPNVGRVTASGFFVMSGTFLQFARGQKYEHNISGSSKLEVSGRPERRVLVQLDVGVDVVAETRRRGNLDVLEVLPDSPIQRAGQSFTLRDSLLMWMTERQARELGDDDKAYSGQLAEVERQTRYLSDNAVQADPHERDRRDNATDRAQPSVPTNRTITLPAMIGIPGRPSFGIGGLDRTLDLSSHIGAVRRAITNAIGGTRGTRVAQALLPESSLDAPHDNVRMLQTFLSHADSHITSALNGGRSLLLRLDGRGRGHTYQMTVTASMVSEPEFKGIVHVDKLTVSDKTKMTLTDVTTRSLTEASVSLMLRGRGIHVEGQSPEAQQHSDPVRVLGGAGAATSANWGAREKEYSDADTLKYSQSLAVEGPVATFGTDIVLSITVTGRELPKAGAVLREVRPLTLRVSPYSSRINGQVGVAGDKGILPSNELTDSARSEWRNTAGVKSLPEPSQYAVEHVFLDMAELHDAAELALTKSGVTVDATTQATLRAAINTTNLKAGLPAMLAGLFLIPLPHQTNRKLFLDARVVGRPRFAGANTDVAIKNSLKGERSQKVTHKSGSTYLVKTRGLLGVREDGRGGMPVERRHYATADSQRYDASATPEKYKTTAQPSSTPEDDTLVWGLSYSLEFSLVALPVHVHRPRKRLQPSARRTHQHRLNPPTSRKRAGVMLRIDDAVILRMNDEAAREHTDIVLPPELKESAKSLAESSKKWTKAVNRRDGLKAKKATDADLLKAAEQEATDAESKWWDAYQAHERQLDTLRPAAPHTDSVHTAEDTTGTEEAQPTAATQETTYLTNAEPSAPKRGAQTSTDALSSPPPTEGAQLSPAAGDTPAIEPDASAPAPAVTDVAEDTVSAAADGGPDGAETAADPVPATPSVVRPSLLATPGDGRCQLYAVIGSDPGLVGERLASAGLDTPALRAWLADPELVRTQLTEQSSPERRDARELVPQSTELGQAAERLRQLVERHLITLGPANVPTVALQAYRGNRNQTLHATVDSLDQATVLNRLHAAGITSLRDPSLLPVAHLRDLYVHHRTAGLTANGTDHASARTIAEQEVPLKPAADGTPARDLADGSLSAQQMFDFLSTHQDIPLRDLPEQVQRDQLTVHLLDPARPADPVEFAELSKAVQHWEQHWHRDVGEAYIGLLASALGSRIRIHTPDHVQTVGPDDAPLITIHRHHDHYQATTTPPPATTTDARVSPTTSHNEPNGRATPTATPSTIVGTLGASHRPGDVSTTPDLTHEHARVQLADSRTLQGPVGNPGSRTHPDRTESVTAGAFHPASDRIKAVDDSRPSIIEPSADPDAVTVAHRPVASPVNTPQATPDRRADVYPTPSRAEADRSDTEVDRPPLVPPEPGQTERDPASPGVASRPHVLADEAEVVKATPPDRPIPEEPTGERSPDPEAPGATERAATTDSGTHTAPPPVTYVPAGLALLDPDQADKMRVALNYPPQSDEYLVFAEGTPDGIVVGNELVTPEHLAALITADTRSHGKDVVLVACETGQRDYDLRLSGQADITAVSASPDTAWVTATGRIFAAATTYTSTGHPQLDRTRPGTWRRTAGHPPVTRVHHHYEYPTRHTRAEPPNIADAIPFGSSSKEPATSSDKKRPKKSLIEDIDQAAKEFTLSYGGGQYGRAGGQFRLRFARDKSAERAAQTLSHLSFKLHDVFRQLREQSKHPERLPKDLEVQGMLINGRLVFATNFNATAGLISKVKFSAKSKKVTPLEQLLSISQSDSSRRKHLAPQDADEYVGRLRRSEEKINEAFRGVRDNDTARAMRANRDVQLADAAPTDDESRLWLNYLLTNSEKMGAVIVLEHSDSDANSIHAEQKLLLAVHSADLQPSDIEGTYLIMGKYRPCLGCWAALNHHRKKNFPVDFDDNYGNYYLESIRSLVSYLPHTIRDPQGGVGNYLEDVIRGEAQRMMSVSALSRQAPPHDAVDNNGPEKVIPVGDAPNRGYVTASDSESAFNQESNKKVKAKRALDFTAGTRNRTLGTGKEKSHGSRAAQRVLNEVERAELAAVWRDRDPERVAERFKFHEARGVSQAEIVEASGASRGTVYRMVRDKDGHERRDGRDSVTRRVASRSGRHDSTVSSTTSKGAGKFKKRPDIDDIGRSSLRDVMRGTGFYQGWKHIEKSQSKSTLKARDIPSALNEALAAARQQYSMQSIADYLHMPRKSLQQHLDKRYGPVNDVNTPQPSPIDEEAPDAYLTPVATDSVYDDTNSMYYDDNSTYYDDDLGRQMYIPPDSDAMDYEPAGASHAGPSSASGSQPPQVTYSTAPITYDIPPQAAPAADPAPPPANTDPVYVSDHGPPVYADNHGRQFYWNPETSQWEYYDDNEWHGYRASDPHGKRKGPR